MITKQCKAKTIAIGVTYAALYAALSLTLSPITYGAIQIRLSGMMLGAVPFLGIGGVIGQTIGCLIVNSVSPLGLIDLVNVAPTLLMSLIIWRLRRKNLLIGLSGYCLVTSLSIALTLNYAIELPVVYTYFTVLVGQIISVVVGGSLVNKSLGKILHANSI